MYQPFGGAGHALSRSPAQRASLRSGQGNALDDAASNTISSSPNGAILSPGIAFVDFDAMAFAERSKLILKCHAAVMFFLPCNVAFDLLDV